MSQVNQRPKAKVVWSSQDRARHKRIREMFKDWHPSPEELIASGEGVHFNLRGEYWALRPLLEELRTRAEEKRVKAAEKRN